MIRNIRSSEKKLFLTFDDGPTEMTEAVLAMLDQHQITATFFVVANRAQQNRNLILKILKMGHAIGNHSLDHRYGAFFSSKSTMKKWIESSENILNELTGRPTVGFRPPAGVCTPPLIEVLAEKQIPLFLWNIRFYDSVFSWTLKKAKKSFGKTKPGDIVLLHDKMRGKKDDIFLRTLDYYISEAKKIGFKFNNLQTY